MIYLSIFGSIILLLSSFVYIPTVLRGHTNPRPLSWLGWFIVLSVGLFSSIYEKGFDPNQLIIIGSAISCLLIFITSVIKKNRSQKIDYLYLTLGIICFIIFIISKDAFIITIFSVFTDLFIGFPTILNAFYNPRSENLTTWVMGVFGTFLAFLPTFFIDDVLLKIYPTYLFLFNLLIMLLCLGKFRE